FAAAPVTGAAHITGGGLEGNFARVLPEDLGARFTWDWPVPEIFRTIAETGGIPDDEMRKVFNMGIGIAFTIPAAAETELKALIAKDNSLSDILRIGELVDG